MDIQYFGIKLFTFSWLILINYTVYYWDKPISKSSYVGFALFLYLKIILLVWFFFLCFFSLVPFFVIFERTKTWQNLCLSMSIANYADCFTLRFVFNVRLMILWLLYIWKRIYIYTHTFNFNHIFKLNTFNVILG